MKKAFFLSVLFFNILLFSIFSEAADLESVFNLNMSLKELSHSTPDLLDSLILSEKYIIIDGTISSITEIERSDNNLILDIHILNGEWVGLEKVEVYKCIVNVSGLEWGNRFPKRKPREITEELILTNNQIMVIGKVSDYVLENSTIIAVVNAEYIRRIQ
jgi:hypothetical protein